MAFMRSIRDAMGRSNPNSGYRRRTGAATEARRFDENTEGFDQFTEEQRGIGSHATQNYYGQLQDFDASDTANRYARGMFDEVSGDLQTALHDEAGRAVGAGRLNTGFYDLDRGDLYRDANRRIGTALAQGAFTATGMQQRNTEAIGQLGTERSVLGAEAQQARREEFLDAHSANEERRKRKRFGIGSALGGLVGFGFGGPGGAAAGAQIGGGLFG